MTPLIPIAAYMKRRIKVLKHCPRQNLLSWLNWHDFRGSLAYVQENGRIVAAGVARPLYDPLLRIDHYAFHEGAETIYADQAASDHPKAFAIIINTMKKRFPYANQFMFKHCKTGRLRSWNLKRFHGLTQLKGGF